jgi:hypothetical protein
MPARTAYGQPGDLRSDRYPATDYYDANTGKWDVR